MTMPAIAPAPRPEGASVGGVAAGVAAGVALSASVCATPNVVKCFTLACWRSEANRRSHRRTGSLFEKAKAWVREETQRPSRACGVRRGMPQRAHLADTRELADLVAWKARRWLRDCGGNVGSRKLVREADDPGGFEDLHVGCACARAREGLQKKECEAHLQAEGLGNIVGALHKRIG
jgi:hypothetical protein